MSLKKKKLSHQAREAFYPIKQEIKQSHLEVDDLTDLFINKIHYNKLFNSGKNKNIKLVAKVVTIEKLLTKLRVLIYFLNLAKF